jgi:hypothetical protein
MVPGCAWKTFPQNHTGYGSMCTDGLGSVSGLSDDICREEALLEAIHAIPLYLQEVFQ